MGQTHPTTPVRWINRTVVGIILATFLSDVGHEMCTAVLPLFLASAGLGPAALGMMEGLADLLMSVSKLGGGVLGQHMERKRPYASLGYLVTAAATAAMGIPSGLAALVSLRSVAWVGRGFRSPLRDYLLADAVAPTHFGRAYGLERAGDMLGAVTGPLLAALLVWAGVEFRTIILWTIVPGLLAAASMFFLTRERDVPPPPARDASVGETSAGDASIGQTRPAFPPIFWLFLGGVFIFGLGDFSRTFLIWLAAKGLGEDGMSATGVVSVAVLLYTLHNLTSALAAYPAGYLGDHYSKLRVLNAGYVLGVITNLMLAFVVGSLGWLVMAIVLSGVYIAVEETLEKAVAAEFLPRELRSLGFGILACANAVGDMASSLYVGFLIEAGRAELAFGIAASFGFVGALCLLWLSRRGTKSAEAT